jgi:uncharacterized surface protein with fasciclin (FAS1) repeats
MLIQNRKYKLKNLGYLMVIVAAALVGWPAAAQYYYGPSIFSPVVYSPTRGPLLAQLKQIGCKKFASLLAKAPKELADRINNGESLTIIAPTDAAFEEFGDQRFEELIKPENQEKLLDFLSYHLVAGYISESDIKAREVKTLSGLSLRLQEVVFGKQFIINYYAKLAGEPLVVKNSRNNDVVVVIVDKVLRQSSRKPQVF